MRTKTMWAVVMMGCAAACGVTGCAAEPEGPSGEPTEVRPAEVVNEEIVGGWTLDVAALRAVPTLAAPAARLLPEAFDPGRVQRDLLRDDGLLEPKGRLRDRSRSESSAFAIEVDPATGTLLAIRKEAPSAPAEVDEAGVTEDARDRLRDFGIPDEEIGGTITRRLLGEDNGRGGRTEGPRLVAYKTFVTRGFGGVLVPGHRAVVTHGPDGSLRKVLVKWPALSTTGHRLTTPLTLAAIKNRVATRLAESGRPRGRAVLGWMQEPTVGEDGSVRLTLKVAARLPAIDHGEIVEEPVIEAIDVDARE